MPIKGERVLLDFRVDAGCGRGHDVKLFVL